MSKKRSITTDDKYRPLAAGFLTGKFINNDTTGTRFDPNGPIGPIIQKMFSGDQLMDAMREFDTAVKQKGLTSPEVAIRWLMHHSALTEDDSVVLGASQIHQIQDTVALTRKGPLPDDVLVLTEELWDSVRELREDII